MKCTSNEECEQCSGCPCYAFRALSVYVGQKDTIWGSDRAAGNKGQNGMNSHLQIATLDTILASTYSLLVVVPDVLLQNRGGHTRTNNTKTGDPSVLSSRRSELE